MSKITLSKQQKEALDFFNKYNYLIVEAPRRTGKTILLQEIVRRNKDKRIALLTVVYPLYGMYYKQFKNVTWFESLEYMNEYELEGNNPFELIIGDEVYIKPDENRMTACAYTNREIKIRWKPINGYWPEDQMKTIRKTLSEEAYMREFGQYES